MIRIVQYNILSTELANIHYYVNTNTKFLQPDSRWLLLKEKLLIEIDKSSIFCLQEVSLYWLEKLVPFFTLNGYNCQYNNYGDKGSGYMGVFISYPIKYKLEAFKIVNIGDSIKNKLIRLASAPELIIKEDIWYQATRKRNTLLCLRLNCNNKVFCIDTYHMPCSHRNEPVGILHTITCINAMNKFADNYKYVLAGDFNFQPGSLLYKIATESGKYDLEKSPNYDTSMVSLRVSTPLISAYATFDKDPAFTNFSHVLDSEIFNGCLDYIFLSRGWKVTAVKKLPSSLPLLPYPSNSEPSDHLLLAADLEIIDRKKCL